MPTSGFREHYMQLAAGTTAQRPSLGSGDAGSFRYNSDTGSTEFWDGNDWVVNNLIPKIDGISGTFYTDIASTIVLTISNYTNVVNVQIREGSTLVGEISALSVDTGTNTVSVPIPSGVYNASNWANGDTATFSVINIDGTPSSNTATRTVVELPTGGNSISTYSFSGTTYRVHRFSSTGTFTNPGSRSVDIMILAGGGSAAGSQGSAGGTGGAGAGGLVYYSGRTLSAGSYTCTVGGGANANANNDAGAAQGGNSSFTGLTTAVGGGLSAQSIAPSGRNGGCGGGGGFGGNTPDNNPGSGTTNQGFAGGNGNTQNSGRGGGGGGNAEAGDTDDVGSGGDGKLEGTSTIYNFQTGSNTTFRIDGTGNYYGGGGGGGSINADGLPGGQGGGGNGDNRTTSNPGTDGLGGGGGGVAFSPGTGGDGGNGVVVVRYAL